MLQTIHVAKQEDSTFSPFQPTDSTETVISKVQQMKRKELLELYFTGSRGPNDMSEIEGEWDGILLDNQSWIMVGTECCYNAIVGRGSNIF